MTVTQADSTLVAMRKMVRRLTASSGAASLSDSEIDRQINTYASQDFPGSIKTDQLKTSYVFYTVPNQARYPLDVNYLQSFRDPVFFEGIQGTLFKDKAQFNLMWPRFPTKFIPASGDGVTQSFSFTLGGAPFLPDNVVIGTEDVSGSSIRISDDGNGNLYVNTPNVQTSVPAITSTRPGQYNLNTGNPGQDIKTYVGAVNYVSGNFSFDLALANLTPANGSELVVWVSQYSAGRPYTMLFYNNYFDIRPVPNNVLRVEVECYMTPVQFFAIDNVPLVEAWWQLIAIGAAYRILQQRQDIEGMSNVLPMLREQESLALQRQANEEVGQQNSTIYNSVANNAPWALPFGWY